MDLLHAVRTFARIAETGSFSAVARETNASHSAVTRLIGQLEAHFGVRLFHRTTRKLSLTDDGQDLLNQAQHLIEVADGIEGTLGKHATSPTGLVRVGTTTTGAMLLTRRLVALLEKHAGLEVELVVRDQLGDMIEERLDVAVSIGQPAELVPGGARGRGVRADAGGGADLSGAVWRADPTRGPDAAHLPDARTGAGQRGVALHRAERA